MEKGRNDDSLEQLYKESIEFGRDLKLLRNACMVLVIFLGTFLIFCLLFSRAFEVFFMEKYDASAAFSPVYFAASLISGGNLLISPDGVLDKAGFLWGCISTLITVCVFLNICHFLSKMFIGISKGFTPFNPVNASYLKKLASALSVLGGIYLLLGTNFITFIIIELTASFFYALSKIFKYGAQLQLLSDETL